MSPQLIPLCGSIALPGGTGLLYTQRSVWVGSHRGQVSFPGGRFDPGDGTLQETALRETEEELGVSRGRIRVLGVLSDCVASTGVIVTPFVGDLGLVCPQEMRSWKVSQREIDRVFVVALPHLQDPAQQVLLPCLPVPPPRTNTQHITSHSRDTCTDICGALTRSKRSKRLHSYVRNGCACLCVSLSLMLSLSH